MTELEHTPKKLLLELKETVKKLPLNERKQAAMLYFIFEEIVANKDEEEKLNDESYKLYSDEINKLTTSMDLIIEGKRKVLDEEVAYWNKNVDANYKPNETDNNQTPIKSFWRKFIENSNLYHGEKDIPILEHLTHVEIADENDPSNEKIRWMFLHLDFSSNEFFDNTKLSLKLIFQGGVVEKSEGTVIQWKNNPTIKKSTKSQKNKRTGQSRTITKETQLRSFFEMFGNFTDEEKKGDEDDQKEHDEDEATMDLFQLEETLNDFNDLLPYALEYYLGVVEEEDEEEGDEDEEDDDEDEEDEDPKHRHGKKYAKKDLNKDSKKPSRKTSEAEKKTDKKDEPKEQPKPECKQQ